jgi:RNA polymerase-binding transcription factor
MNTDEYKRRLRAQEQELLARTARSGANAREVEDESARDAADESVADEMKAEQFTEAEADRVLLTQIRDALGRIEAGTFGACLVDGQPIEPKRLDASPWTPYCLKHQQLLEQKTTTRMPTL